MTIERDTLHRTLKLELDSGRATSVEDAWALVRTYVLQVVVDDAVLHNATGRAALMTAINAGSRAFLGGVHVRLTRNETYDWPLVGRLNTSTVVTALGGTVVDDVDDLHPTIVIGDADAVGSVVVHATWDGWAAGVVLAAEERLSERPYFPPAGVAAAAIAVSEAFQHLRGLPMAGRRAIGMSLWRPDMCWLEGAAAGEAPGIAPSLWWLLGLGHLGQAYAWTIGTLPYVEPADVTVWLQDVDTIVEANLATSLLATSDSLGRLKTRLVSSALERAGFRTRIIERLFAGDVRPQGQEPTWAMAGFDGPGPRQLLGAFDAAFDGGLGSGAPDYLHVVIHAFPAATSPEEAFVIRERSDPVPTAPAYERLVGDAIEAGQAEGEARCGVLDIAGAAVGAAFVGSFAAALLIAEAVRALIDGPRFDIVSVSLRDPNLVATAPASRPAPPNPGFAPLKF